MPGRSAPRKYVDRIDLDGVQARRQLRTCATEAVISFVPIL
jgi:hypothetical protein